MSKTPISPRDLQILRNPFDVKFENGLYKIYLERNGHILMVTHFASMEGIAKQEAWDVVKKQYEANTGFKIDVVPIEGADSPVKVDGQRIIVQGEIYDFEEKFKRYNQAMTWGDRDIVDKPMDANRMVHEIATSIYRYYYHEYKYLLSKAASSIRELFETEERY